MIYITGDTHIPTDIGKLSSKRFPEQKNLTKNDYVIICGDFGGVWDESNEEKYWIKWLNKKVLPRYLLTATTRILICLNRFLQLIFMVLQHIKSAIRFFI